MTNYRAVTTIQKDIVAARKELRGIVRAAGDDMGCDGTAQQAAAARGEVEALERELAEARGAAARKELRMVEGRQYGHI